MNSHTYRTTLSWSGNTTDYESYNRRHGVTVGPMPLTVSADEAFRGDPTLPNPEQMLVAAASSCQLLTFLAAAALSPRIEVLRYDDVSEGFMPLGEQPARITRIVLRPHITVRGETAERVEQLLHKSHQQCYIANSLTSEIVLEPVIEVI